MLNQHPAGRIRSGSRFAQLQSDRRPTTRPGLLCRARTAPPPSPIFRRTPTALLPSVFSAGEASPPALVGHAPWSTTWSTRSRAPQTSTGSPATFASTGAPSPGPPSTSASPRSRSAATSAASWSSAPSPGATAPTIAVTVGAAETGRILWAYGLDLSPLSLLTAEIQRQASVLEAEEREHRDLRERLSRARRHSRDAPAAGYPGRSHSNRRRSASPGPTAAPDSALPSSSHPFG